jgi:hypothetical protein
MDSYLLRVSEIISENISMNLRKLEEMKEVVNLKPIARSAPIGCSLAATCDIIKVA